jgi:hypothetical protein
MRIWISLEIRRQRSSDHAYAKKRLRQAKQKWLNPLVAVASAKAYPHAAFFKKRAETLLSPPKADSADKAKMPLSVAVASAKTYPPAKSL